jgi:hypothetical protein
MKYETFDIADVISVMFNIYICPNGPAGIYKLLEHMVGHAVTEENFDDCVAACSHELQYCKVMKYTDAKPYVDDMLIDISKSKSKGVDSSKERCALLVAKLTNLFSSSTIQVKPIIKNPALKAKDNLWYEEKKPKFLDYIDFYPANKSGKTNGIDKYTKYIDQVKKLSMEYPNTSFITATQKPDYQIGTDGSIITAYQKADKTKFYYPSKQDIAEYFK